MTGSNASMKKYITIFQNVKKKKNSADFSATYLTVLSDYQTYTADLTIDEARASFVKKCTTSRDMFK